jgi:hypothetical protein
MFNPTLNYKYPNNSIFSYWYRYFIKWINKNSKIFIA